MRQVTSEGGLRAQILQLMRDHAARHGVTFAIVRLGSPGAAEPNWRLVWHEPVGKPLLDASTALLDKFDVP